MPDDVPLREMIAGVNAHNFAGEINQGPAAVSRINRCVRLQIIAETIHAIRPALSS